MTQTQCPNCGGYKVGVRSYPITEYQEHRLNVGQRLLMAVLATLTIIMWFVPWTWRYVFGGTVSGQYPVGSTNDYSCILCGFKWKDGDVLPPVAVRPDLIMKGEQRLEEEQARKAMEEERARRAAADHYWIKAHGGK